MRKLRGFEQLALLYKVEPVRNVIVDRALPLAVGVAAVEAAACLRGRVGAVVMTVDLAEMINPRLGRLLCRILPRNLEELKRMPGHYAACLSDSIKEPSSVALGFTTQNFGK